MSTQPPNPSVCRSVGDDQTSESAADNPGHCGASAAAVSIAPTSFVQSMSRQSLHWLIRYERPDGTLTVLLRYPIKILFLSWLNTFYCLNYDALQFSRLKNYPLTFRILHECIPYSCQAKLTNPFRIAALYEILLKLGIGNLQRLAF